MVSKLAAAAEGVKDKILGTPTYKTTVKKFDEPEEFAAALVKGDTIVAGPDIAHFNLGIAAGSQHEVDHVEGETVVLKGGRKLMAELFVQQLTRRERVRVKANRTELLALARVFATKRWADFSVDMDKRITTAQENVAKAAAEVERAMNRHKQSEEVVASLQRAKINGNAWSAELVASLISLVDQKLFSNFEIIQDGNSQVFIVYTGPILVTPVVPNAKPEDKKPEPVRGEYAVKIYEPKALTRVVIENVGPGKLPTDVPFNEGRSGVCNVCFGDQGTELSSLIQSEDWRRLLIMIRAFLEGNRKN